MRANGKELLSKTIDKAATQGGWLEQEIDLADYAGKRTRLELLNQPTGWSYEAAYWAEIKLLP